VPYAVFKYVSRYGLSRPEETHVATFARRRDAEAKRAELTTALRPPDYILTWYTTQSVDEKGAIIYETPGDLFADLRRR
jgi:predicted transcriptional regulator